MAPPLNMITLYTGFQHELGNRMATNAIVGLLASTIPKCWQAWGVGVAMRACWLLLLGDNLVRFSILSPVAEYP